MRLAIMQPYFLPYIGYFQLISAADVFVIYDNIKYTKKGWINRNRILCNGMDANFTLPLRSDSDQCHIRQRFLAESFSHTKLLRQFVGAYNHAPYFGQIYPLLEEICQYGDRNLFNFLNHGLRKIALYLGAAPHFVTSSEIEIDHSLRGQDKVLAICRVLGAKTYINSIGGQGLYDRGSFCDQGVNLCFLQPKPLVYQQFGGDFVPWLSIIDVLMFNPLDQVQALIQSNYELI
jgi:hypothetical protein